MLLAIASYALALEHILKTDVNDLTLKLKFMDSEEILIIIELHLIIRKNLNKSIDIRDLIRTISNKEVNFKGHFYFFQLSSMLLSRISWLFKNSVRKNQNTASFIKSDIAQRNYLWEFTEMNIEEFLPIAWKNLSNINFLRRFTWILNNEEIAEYEYCK